MGIIVKQSIKGTIFSYIGVVLGFLTVGLLWPKLLDADQIGLINFILAFSTILAQIGSLGTNSVIIRLFPYFRDKENQHHGFFPFIILIALSGFILISFSYIYLKPTLISNNLEKSQLIIGYINYLLPFTLSLLLFNIFDNYNKVLYDAVSGTFAKELLFRILNFLLIVLFYFNLITFHQFFICYFIIFSIPIIYLIIVLQSKKELSFRLNLNFISKNNLTKSIISVSSFGLIGGFGTLAIASIDKIMINKYLDLNATGIYSTSILFASLVLIPARTLGKISGTLIADAWKNKNHDQINSIYKKSCINQLVVGTFIFLLIVTNLELLYHIIPEEYQKGKLVIYFIGIANLFDMATGTNGIIISTSRYYRYQSVFVFLLLLLVVVTNIIFIPLFGITGAAIASSISTLVYNLIRYIFLLVKFKFQPFNWRFPLIILASVVILLVCNFLFVINNPYVATIINSAFIISSFALIVYYLDISEEFKSIVDLVLRFKYKK